MATVPFVVTPDNWTDLGPTPCFIENTSLSTVVFVVDTQAPAASVKKGHILEPSDRRANITFTGQRVYARSLSDTVSDFFVTR